MRWLFYLWCAFVLFVLQLSFGGILTIGGARPDLLLPFIVFQGLRNGPVAGTISGALCGLAVDLLGTGPIGARMFAGTIVGFVVGKLWREGPFRLHWPWGAMLLGGALFQQIIIFYFRSREATLPFGDLYLRYGIPNALYTTALGIIWFLSPLYRPR
ncbi:MAG: rod shape-determining protein MreD [bacterium]